MIPIDDGRTADEHSSGTTTPRSGRWKPSRRLMVRAGAVVLGLVLVTGAAGAVLAHQISAVRSQLQQTVDLVPQLRSELSHGNHLGAQQTFELMQQSVSAARSTTTAPLWKGASFIPFAGINFSAVREVSVSADDVVSRAVGPLMDKYDELNFDAMSPKDGRIDVSGLQKAAPSISKASDTVRLSHQRLASIDRSRLIPQLAEPVRSATVQLEELATVLDTASSSAQLLPAMLGADEPRNYLILVQNSAEARATGGIPGALAILHTDDGRISLGEQSSAVALGSFVPPLQVDPEQESLYTARLGTQMQNVNLTPDFPTAAATAKGMWEQRHNGQKIDGVLALDPVVLGNLLEATGPVDLTDPEVLSLVKGTSLPTSLTKDNVIPTLLSDVYREIEDPALQDIYFAAVAGRVFAAFTDGQGDSGQLIQALGTSAKDHRLYLWSSQEDEQSIISSTELAGSVTGPDAGGASFGVYFNDGTGAKMDYHAARTVKLIQKCESDGYSSYTVRVTVTNNAPVDAATSLPAYVTGGGAFGVEPGNFRTNYVLYGPAQSFVESARVNGDPVPVGSGKHGLRPVGTITQELAPGETAVIEVDFTRVVQDSEPRLHITPTVQPVTDVVLPAIREEACQ